MSETTALPVTEKNISTLDSEKMATQQSLREFIHYLIKKWWVLFIIGMIAAAIGFFYAKMQTVKYESNLTFVIQQEGGSSGISGAMGLAAQFGLDLGGTEAFSGENILEIIRSRKIIENVLLSAETFNGKSYTLIEYLLHQLNGNKKSNSRLHNVHFPINQDRKTFSYVQDSVLFLTYKNLATNNLLAEKVDKKLSIYAIKVLSDNEQFTKIFTERLIQQTDIFYTEICSKKERETLQILEQRVAAMKGSLSSSIATKAAEQDANVNPAFAAAQVPLQIQQSNIQVYGAAYAEMFKNLELARYQYLKNIPLIQLIDEAKYPMKKIKVGKLKTAIIFSFAAIFLVVFILWLKRLYKLYL